MSCNQCWNGPLPCLSEIRFYSNFAFMLCNKLGCIHLTISFTQIARKHSNSHCYVIFRLWSHPFSDLLLLVLAIHGFSHVNLKLSHNFLDALNPNPADLLWAERPASDKAFAEWKNCLQTQELVSGDNSSTLTAYISSTAPPSNTDACTNWIPAPNNAPFFSILRIYGATGLAKTNQYAPPAFVKASPTPASAGWCTFTCVLKSGEYRRLSLDA